MDTKTQLAINQINQKIQEENNKPLTVSIMGQTGVGKSSLLNALFKSNLNTDAVKPCTKDIEKIIVKGSHGHEIHFFDMPGIGESEQVDVTYLKQYLNHLKLSDIVLWAMNCDNRSTTFDKRSLTSLLSLMDEEEKIAIFSKITFVLTKADILTPPAWVYGKQGTEGIFAPLKETKNILKEKEKFFQKTFIGSLTNKILSSTYNDCNFVMNDERFHYDDNSIYFNGILDELELKQLKETFPQYVKIFDRLFANYEVIACSSLFKYNLNKLMVVIINKLGKNSIERFNNLIATNILNIVTIEEVKTMGNIIVIDNIKKEVLFDFNNIIF